jgi:hypothetical protein
LAVLRPCEQGRYLDYVLDAFNADTPYDQFLREQLAGDQLPADSQRQRDRQLIATGFLALGVRDVNQRFKVARAEKALAKARAQFEALRGTPEGKPTSPVRTESLAAGRRDGSPVR